MKTLLQVIRETLIEAGMSKTSKKTEKTALDLHNLFESQWETIELQTAIRELELAITQKNKMLYGDSIQPDIQQRDMIDPNIIGLRVQGLKKRLEP